MATTAVDWAAAHTATGVYLEAICKAANVDRSQLDLQRVDVVLRDDDLESETKLPFSYGVERTPSPVETANETALAARREFEQAASAEDVAPREKKEKK